VRHIGVDLHKTNFVACFIEADDTRLLETYPLTRDGLARFVARLEASDELAVEATQNVHYFYDQVKTHVRRVAVVDTYRFGVVAKSKKKTDKADAAALARFLKRPRCRCRRSRCGACGSYFRPGRRWSRCGRSSRTWRTPPSRVTASRCPALGERTCHRQ
jgi:transposase